MPTQPSSLAALYATPNGTSLSFTPPTTSPNLQDSSLVPALEIDNTPSLDFNGTTPPSYPVASIILNSPLENLLETALTPSLDLNGSTPPKYLDNSPT